MSILQSIKYYLISFGAGLLAMLFLVLSIFLKNKKPVGKNENTTNDNIKSANDYTSSTDTYDKYLSSHKD